MAGRIAKLAGIGFFMGMMIGVIMLLIVSYVQTGGKTLISQYLLDMAGSEANALLLQMAASGVYGAICMAGVALYEIESWGLLKTPIVHYLICTVSFCLIGSSMGWISLNAADIGIVAGTFAVVYLIIWVIMYRRYRSEVDELNEMIRTDGAAEEY